MSVDQEAVLEALKAVQDPDLHQDIVTLGFVKDLVIDGTAVSFTVDLTTPACPIKEELEKQSHDVVAALDGVSSVDVTMTASVRTGSGPGLAGGENVAPTVKNIILVGSGKGGVGKSTVALNLAIALQQFGATVGLMDADVYGPSLPTMLGIKNERPKTTDGKHLQPLEAHGLKTMSIGFLVEPEQALIWRGPMLNQAVIQFLRDVEWGELDYLIIDLPPGTGDVQLTIAQQVRAAGAVLVTTPQDVALVDVVRAKGMLDRVQIPVLGIVENMSYFTCPHCNERTEIFDRGGGAAAAERMKIPFLGEIPINPRIREGGDGGTPILVLDPDCVESRALVEIARQVAHQVSVSTVNQPGQAAPTLRMSP